jgi:hypothetical protein
MPGDFTYQCDYREILFLLKILEKPPQEEQPPTL